MWFCRPVIGETPEVAGVRGWAGVRWRADEDVEAPHPLNGLAKYQEFKLKDQDDRLGVYEQVVARLHADIDRKAQTIARLQRRLEKLGAGPTAPNEGPVPTGGPVTAAAVTGDEVGALLAKLDAGAPAGRED